MNPIAHSVTRTQPPARKGGGSDSVFSPWLGMRFLHRTLVGVLGFVVLVAVSLGATPTVVGQHITPDELVGPFVDSEPFDVIYLNEHGENAIMKIMSLNDNFPTLPYPDRGILVFEYLVGEGDRLEVPYSSIKEIRSFHDLLIEEANGWIKDRQFSKAFRNLFFVYNHGGKDDEELVKSLKNCMFLDGAENFKIGEYELALSIFEDIFQRTPEFRLRDLPDRPLIEIIMLCYDGIISRQFETANYVGVRRTLDSVVDKYPTEADGLNQRWTAAFKKRGDELLAEARQLAEKGEGRRAHQVARQANQMIPDRPEVVDYQKQLLIQFPLVIIGVSQSAGDGNPANIADWGARRVGRLTQRRIMEITGLTDEGGKYDFLNGTMVRTDEIGREYTLEIKEDPTRFAVPTATAFEISMRLLLLADRESPSFNANWAKIVNRISILDENRIAVSLKTPFIRPEALLKTAYSDPGPDGISVQNGPYVTAMVEKDISIFDLNPAYKRRPGRQHPVIVERLFPDSSTAVDQLIMGNIDIVDRVPISDIERLKSTNRINVGTYLMPTVHMLVPKIRGDLEDNAIFRRGLSYAIDRELLVHDVICAEKEIDGCEPISGPFPIGTEDNDQISYAYDMNVRPLAYNEKLSMVFIELALRAKPPKFPDPIPVPNLVLAHPSSSSAANASAAIARSWTQAGVPTSTRALKSGESMPPDDEWDFLYLEVSVEEPLSDAARMIGAYGFAKNVSAPIEQTLRILSYAESWQTACSALRRLHRQISIDLSVIPLWQVKEHYAYRSSVRNIGRDLIHLYQNVDRWTVDLSVREVENEKQAK